LPSVDAASVEIYLGHATENGQWVALIIHVSINCHFVALSRSSQSTP